MRIAHVSDLHLRLHLPGSAEIETRLSRRMPAYFEAALTQIRRYDPDLFVLSGDLLDYPFDGFGDAETEAQGLADLNLIAGLLKTMPVPIVVIHGNHDHPHLLAQVFADTPNDYSGNGFRVLAFADDEGADHVPVRVGASQAHFLDALAAADSLPQVHVQHYVVWPERNVGYPHTYGQGAHMRDQIIASGNVRLVLSGHYHPGIPLFADKGVYFSTVPGFAEAPHRFCIYDLDHRGEVTCKTLRLEI